MDDTICDFTNHYKRMLIVCPEILFPQSQYGFFTDLKPIEQAIDSVNKLRVEFDVYILTRPSIMNPLCYTEKRIWIEKHFGIEFCENLILCCDKSLLKGDYLIDDNYWPDFEGIQLTFGNEEYKDWDQVLKYFYEKK